MKVAIGHRSMMSVDVGKYLQKRGHDVFFFNPGYIKKQVIRKEGMGNRIVEFNQSRVEELPRDSQHHIDAIDFNTNINDNSFKKVQNIYHNTIYYLDELQIDTGFYSNDFFIDSVAASDHCIETVYTEKGYFPETLQIDTEGVNCNSSLADMDFEGIIRLENEWRYQNIFPLTSYPTIDVSIKDQLKAAANYLKEEREMKKIINRFPSKRSNTESVADLDLSKKYAFVPFQVHDDTQVLYNTPELDSMEEFLSVIIDSFEKIDEEIEIIVKEHPADIGRIDYSELREKYDVIWIKNYPIGDLITNANIVFTLNSSVGFQSLSKYKPVITFGDAIYNSHPHVAYHPDPKPEKVGKSINDLLSRDLQTEIVDKYVESVVENFFIPGTSTNYSSQTISNIVSFIEG